MAGPDTSRTADGTVRYAVVGLGHIAQVAVLPAFGNAENAEVAALVSGDETKRRELGACYGVETVDYEQYDDLLASGKVDAVYITVPNHLHCTYAVRAAAAGVHVLCEKPMAVTEAECREMIHAAEANDVRLMVAYRLHFEQANLEAVQAVKQGQIGEPRIFASTFTQDVTGDNIRLGPVSKGGGPVYDLGIYCINAARYLFRDEPYEVAAVSERRDDPRFSQCEEMVSAIVRFPHDRLATFTCSFGAWKTSRYRMIGTAGQIELDPAYLYATHLTGTLESADGSRRVHRFPKRDQFAPELIHFSECVLHARRPEPDANEGLADVRIIEALYESVRTGETIRIAPAIDQKRPEPEQAISRPGFEKPEETHAAGPRE